MTSEDVSPEAQVDMQVALQRHVDGAISKTVLLPDDCDATRLGRLLRRAHRGGAKGLAVHRLGRPRGDVVFPACADRPSCEAG